MGLVGPLSYRAALTFVLQLADDPDFTYGRRSLPRSSQHDDENTNLPKPRVAGGAGWSHDRIREAYGLSFTELPPPIDYE